MFSGSKLDGLFSHISRIGNEAADVLMKLGSRFDFYRVYMSNLSRIVDGVVLIC